MFSALDDTCVEGGIDLHATTDGHKTLGCEFADKVYTYNVKGAYEKWGEPMRFLAEYHKYQDESILDKVRFVTNVCSKIMRKGLYNDLRQLVR